MHVFKPFFFRYMKGKLTKKLNFRKIPNTMQKRLWLRFGYQKKRLTKVVCLANLKLCSMLFVDINAKMSWRPIWGGKEVGDTLSSVLQSVDTFVTALRIIYPATNAPAISPTTTTTIPPIRTPLQRFEELLLRSMVGGAENLSSSGCNSILASNKYRVSVLSIRINF